MNVRSFLLMTMPIALACIAGFGCNKARSGNQNLTGNSSTSPPALHSTASDLKYLDYGPQLLKTAPGSVLSDIVSHLPSSYGSTYYDSNLVTWGHETSHGISAHLRNNFNTTGRNANAFYVLGDRAIIVAEPKIIKRQVGPYVPSILRASRFSLYIEGQPAWDGQPLYILDEMNAYTNGAAVALNLQQNDLWPYGRQDVLAGMIEFISYSLALGRAVEVNDSEYFQTYPQFKAYLGFAIERAMTTYWEGRHIPEFQNANQDELLKLLREANEAKELRDFAVGVYGQAWVDRVLLKNEPPGEITPQFASDKDDDGDSVFNRLDKCPQTETGKKVWTYGDWIGCGEGEERS